MAGCSDRCNFFIADKQDFGPRLDVVIPALKPWQMDIAWIQRPHPHCGKRAATPVNMLTADRARQAYQYQVYWRVLTGPGRWSVILQALLLIAPLLTVQNHGSRDGSDAGLRELADLAKFQLIWCAWCEQLYSLRRRFQASDTMNCSPVRRLVLDLYGGFLFMTVLSLLATVNPLLGIGAMFLLFTSVEALDVSMENRSTLGALAGGLERSFRMLSAEPWRFLGRLLLPGLVLYASGVVVVILRQWAEQQDDVALRLLGWLITGTALVFWLAFFALAQLRIQMRAMAMDIDDLPAIAASATGSAQTQPRSRIRLLKPLRQLVADFDGLCSWIAAAIGILITLWIVLQLGRNGLFTLPALVLAFQAVVVLVTSIVQAFLDLLLKIGFLALVLGAVVGGVVVVIGIGRRRLRSLLQEMAQALRSGIGAFGDFLARDLRLSSATLGIGTLLTALGTVAMQTYARVQEGQLQQRQQEQAQELRRQEEQAVSQEHNMRIDGLEKQLNERLATYISAKNSADPDKRAVMVADLRGLLQQLHPPSGVVDGDRKGKLLRNLYESGMLLTSNSDPKCNSTNLEAVLQSKLRGEAQRDAEAEINKKAPGCLPRIFLDSMNFSGANLEGAYLAKAFIPYIDLRNANLRGANLQGADLSHALLEAADLSGADLKGTILKGGNVVGADLTGVTIDCLTKLDDLVAFFAHFSTSTRQAIHKCAEEKNSPKRDPVVSWELLKEAPGREHGRNGLLRSDTWTFCPLDPESERSVPTMIQAGAKCANRQFMGGKAPGNGPRSHPLAYRNQNWSGGLFTKARFESLTLKDVQLVGADLKDARFTNVRLHNVDFWGADLKGAVITDSTLENVDFTGADLRGLRFERVRARNVQFRGILLDKSLNLGAFNEAQLHRGALTSEEFDQRIQDQPATFRQDLMAPVLFAPLPLRPLHLLYWMVTG